MILDEETLRALEWDAVLERVARHTNAGHAAGVLSAWRPFERVEDAREALAEVGEGMALLDDRDAFPAPYVVDHARTLRLLSAPGATVEGPALVSAARTLEGVRKLAAFLRRGARERPRLAARFSQAPSLPDLERRILDAFDPEGRLQDAASPELRRLRGEVRGLRKRLVDMLNGLIAGLPHVLVAADSRPTVREGRYVVPLRREALSEVPGIVHDESVSGATVFLEPHAAVVANNELRQAELAVRREEDRILRELTAALAERRVELEHAARLALHAETVFARARYALAVNGSPPELGGDRLEIVGGRHPLLMARVEEGTGEVVPLDLALGPGDRTLVVTGPNTGGKTVLLKTVGTVVLMAQSGIVPPVGLGTRVPWHAAVIADIGDTQSIAQDLSTFTAHLTRLKKAWETAGPATLILVDEIGASTDPAEGAALATALLEDWTERGARTLVTTHYHALKVLAAGADGLVNGSLAYDLERNRPLFRFVQGVPGRSFGIELAERWGFSPPVVRTARERLERGVQEVEAVIDRLVAEEKRHREAGIALEEERRAIGAAESARARRTAAEADERRRSAERRLAGLEEQLARLRREIREQQRKLRERTSALAEAEAAAAQARELARETERVATSLRAERDAALRVQPSSAVRVGDRVRIPRYDVTGVVVQASREEDTAAVQAGQVRITCRLSECELVEAAEEADATRPAPAEGIESEAESLPLEIDLRGLTADEVGFPLAGALERAYHTGRPIVRFIHGKGTGVLRRRVAELLDRHPYVREFRTGHWNEGGDGVTIATLTGPDGKE
ncbi:MAG TPA: Smr/MutS family protein [Gemmatimonadota bacterium]|nr:Smr/MutS family protein [Gemmatimonadota bacterium]